MELQDINPYLRFVQIINYNPTSEYFIAVDYHFYFMISDYCTLKIDKTEHTLQYGSVVIIPPGMRYKFDAPSKLEIVSINFDYTQNQSLQVKEVHPMRADEFDTNSIIEKVYFTDYQFLNEPTVIAHMGYLSEPINSVINEFTYSGEMYGSSIKRLVLPEDIVELKGQSFSFCRQLSEVVMPDRYIKWGFQSIDPESKWFHSFETNVADPALVLAYAGKNVIGYCGPFGGKYTDLYIKDGTVGIPPLTFSYVNVQTIHIPASVTEIGYNNFNSKQTIAAPKGSFAEKYAIENNLQYKPE